LLESIGVSLMGILDVHRWEGNNLKL
jgi:hypothetical protein